MLVQRAIESIEAANRILGGNAALDAAIEQLHATTSCPFNAAEAQKLVHSVLNTCLIGSWMETLLLKAKRDCCDIVVVCTSACLPEDLVGDAARNAFLAMAEEHYGGPLGKDLRAQLLHAFKVDKDSACMHA